MAGSWETTEDASAMIGCSLMSKMEAHARLVASLCLAAHSVKGLTQNQSLVFYSKRLATMHSYLMLWVSMLFARKLVLD